MLGIFESVDDATNAISEIIGGRHHSGRAWK